MYYPMHGFGGPKEIDLYSTKRWRRSNYAELDMVAPDQRPGINGHPQADSLGDRGEFDEDNSGGGKLYVGVFDRKLHLAGAEWGAWTVDKNAEYHGGNKTPSPNRSHRALRKLLSTRTPTRTVFSTRSNTTTTAIARSTCVSRYSITVARRIRIRMSYRWLILTSRAGKG